MPRTVSITSQGARVIAATFTNRVNAERAVEALQAIGISPIDIQIVVQLNAHSGKDLYSDILSDRGFTRAQARYYDSLIRHGRTLVAVYDVADPAPVLDIFHEFEAEFNPDSSRNPREDVPGLTTGAAAGKAAEHRE